MKAINDLHDIVYQSFITEVNAYKPGNVSRYADGHDMDINDFILSAEVSTPWLVKSDCLLGERIYQAVAATQKAVSCNTNLGMLLLFAPVLVTVQQYCQRQIPMVRFQKDLQATIAGVNLEESKKVFRAIALASPGGLGNSEEHDINSSPDVSLLDAMTTAESWDRVAWQFSHAYDDVINIGLSAIKDWAQRWNSVEYAAVYAYLSFLSGVEDTHVKRKFGEQTAYDVSSQAKKLLSHFRAVSSMAEIEPEINELDKKLKQAGINPGTTADLTAASVLLYLLIDCGILATP